MKKIFSYFTIIVCLLILGNMKNAYAAEIKTDDIANSTYVIGKCMFTRDISDKYSGSLSTDVIMLAAKTIDSNNLEDMIIYYKNARGIWVNALNNEQVEMNETVEIEYKNNVEYIQTPTLTKVAGNATTAQLTVFFEGAYANETISISGYELYEKNGNTLTLIDTIETTFGT
ncbi:MAG: hypothetical protein PUD07_03025, partial [bacterium]|nr:hypothetical protein [bacterium]